jgi:hypothetical protein
LWIFFTLNGQLLGELVLEIFKICKERTHMYIYNLLILTSAIINGSFIINQNLQVGKFKSVPPWIASFRQSQFGMNLLLKPTSATTQRNLSSTTSKMVPD